MTNFHVNKLILHIMSFSALHLNDKLVACCRLLRCQQSSSLAGCVSKLGSVSPHTHNDFQNMPTGEERGRGQEGEGEPCGKHQTQYTSAASGHTSLLFGKLYSLNSDSFIMMLRNIFPYTYSQFSNCCLFLAE